MKLKIKHFIWLLLLIITGFFENYAFPLYSKSNYKWYELMAAIFNSILLISLTIFILASITNWIIDNWNKTIINLSKQNED